MATNYRLYATKTYKKAFQIDHQTRHFVFFVRVGWAQGYIENMSEYLPLKQIFLRSIRMPFENHKELLRLGWPYATIILIFSFIPENYEGFSIYIAYLVLVTVTGVLGIVGCHRVFLLPKETVAETSTFRWSPRESNFLLSMVGIGIMSSIISIPFYAIYFYLEYLDVFANVESGIILKIIFMLILIPVTYVVSRWSLVLPDTAVDHDNTFSWAWNVSSRHSFRLFVLIGAIPLTTNLTLEFITSFTEPSNLFSLVQNTV